MRVSIRSIPLILIAALDYVPQASSAIDKQTRVFAGAVNTGRAAPAAMYPRAATALSSRLETVEDSSAIEGVWPNAVRDRLKNNSPPNISHTVNYDLHLSEIGQFVVQAPYGGGIVRRESRYIGLWSAASEGYKTVRYLKRKPPRREIHINY
jgi:hypothetical protein